MSQVISALSNLLLGPAAFLSGSDPTWVVGEIALAGSLAVLPAWWLARSVGGPLAGALSGGIIAISATAIGESTSIWNPNLVMLPAGLAINTPYYVCTDVSSTKFKVSATFGGSPVDITSTGTGTHSVLHWQDFELNGTPSATGVCKIECYAKAQSVTTGTVFWLPSRCGRSICRRLFCLSPRGAIPRRQRRWQRCRQFRLMLKPSSCCCRRIT